MMSRTFVGLMMFLLCTGLLAGCSSSGGSGEASDVLGLTGPVIQGGKPTLQILPAAPSVGTSRDLPMVFLVKDAFGQPAPDETKILVSFTFGGRLDPVELTTKDGHAQAVYTAGSNAGVENVTAATMGITGSTTVLVQANPPARPLVQVRPALDQVRPGQASPIVVFVNNSSGNAVATSVIMFSGQGGTFAPPSGTSDDGMFVTEYTASTSVGVDVIGAIAGGTTATASLAVVP